MTDPQRGAGGALADVRVVELAEGLAAPMAARLLGDFGAEVTKVERPAGDPVRRDGPHAPGDDGHSALFEYLNWNKRGVAMDLSAPAQRDALHTLLEGADILVHGFGPGVLEAAWGLDPQTLHQRHPHLCIVAISDFGWSGPHAHWHGSDLVMQALGGVMSFSGLRQREPLKPGLRQSYYCAGMNGAYVAMAAYLEAARSGTGSLVDLSVLEVVASELVSVFPAYSLAGIIAARRSSVQDPLLSGEPLPVSDGYVTLQVNTLYGPERFAEVLDEPRLADPAYATSRARIEAASSLRAVLTGRLAREKGRDIFERANEAGLLAGVLQGAGQLLECHHLQSREVWAGIGGAPGQPAWKLPAQIARMSATPVEVRRPAPRLGRDKLEALLVEARQACARRTRAVAATNQLAQGPLAGLRVLDLSTVFAAPYMAALLSDLGAEVIKIEAPKRLDQLRAGGFGFLVDNDPGEAGWNRCSSFQMLNRGKRSLVLDLQTEAGRQVLRELVAVSDILIDNFTPRVMRDWGLPYAELQKINPKLVMLSNTGYGSTGPWSSYRAQGTTLEATMGVGAYAGYPGEAPAKVGQSYPDFLAAWSGLTGIMAALVHRQRTGEGQWIDLGMYQLGPIVIPEALIAVQAGQEDVGCRGNLDWGALLGSAYPVQGDDEWIVASALEHAHIEALRVLLALDGTQPVGAIDAALRHWCATRSGGEAVAALQAAGIPAGRVNNARDLVRDPHLGSRGFFEKVDMETSIGVRALIGRPYVWLGAEVGIKRRAPFYGEDNDIVLGQVLGKSAGDIQALRDALVVTDRPQNPPRLQPEDLQALVRRGTIKEFDPTYRDPAAA